MLDPMTGQPYSAPQIYSVELKREMRDGRVRVEAVPPEEFLIDRRATGIHDATIVAHRRMMTVSDLVALGYDKDEVEYQAEYDKDQADYMSEKHLAQDKKDQADYYCSEDREDLDKA